jgi:hypothetical protein
VNDEIERIVRERQSPNFKVLSRHSLGGTEGNQEKPQDIPSPGRDMNPGSPKYEARVLTTRPRYSVDVIVIVKISC